MTDATRDIVRRQLNALLLEMPARSACDVMALQFAFDHDRDQFLAALQPLLDRVGAHYVRMGRPELDTAKILTDTERIHGYDGAGPRV